MHLNLNELNERLKKVYIEGWNYAKGQNDYFGDVRNKFQRLHSQILERYGNHLAVSEPVGDINCYRICIPLESELPADRHDIQVAESHEVGRSFAYIEILVGVVAMVAEVSVYLYKSGPEGYVRHVYDIEEAGLQDERLEATSHALWFGKILEEAEIPRVSRSIAERPADPDLPRDIIYHSGPVLLRDYLFLNGCD